MSRSRLLYDRTRERLRRSRPHIHSNASSEERSLRCRNQFGLRKRPRARIREKDEELSNSRIPNRCKTKILVTLGGGGHTAEMLTLLSLLSDKYEYHFLVAKGVELGVCNISRTGEIHEIRQPRGRHDSLIVAISHMLIAAFQVAAIMVRVRPDVVVGCGPAISVLASVLGKIAGAKTIYVETASRVTTLSLTGKILYRTADLFFVQWPTLQQYYPKAVFSGRLK